MIKRMVARVIVILLISSFAHVLLAAKVDATRVTRPEGTAAPEFDKAELLKKGEALWNDKSLSKKGKTSCASCHKNNVGMFKKSFLIPYPHKTKMAKSKGGVESISAEGMVQFCMIVPMKADTFAWDSEDLAALTAYTTEIAQPAYIEKKAKKR